MASILDPTLFTNPKFDKIRQILDYLHRSYQGCYIRRTDY